MKIARVEPVDSVLHIKVVAHQTRLAVSAPVRQRICAVHFELCYMPYGYKLAQIIDHREAAFHSHVLLWALLPSKSDGRKKLWIQPISPDLSSITLLLGSLNIFSLGYWKTPSHLRCNRYNLHNTAAIMD